MAVSGVISSWETSASSCRRALSDVSSARARLASSSAIWLNDAASAATSSPPYSGARAAEIAGAESLGGGLNFPEASPRRTEHHEGDERGSHQQHAARDQAHGRTELSDDPRERRVSGDHDDAADLRAVDDYRRQLAAKPRPWKELGPRASAPPAEPAATALSGDELGLGPDRRHDVRRHVVMIRGTCARRAGSRRRSERPGCTAPAGSRRDRATDSRASAAPTSDATRTASRRGERAGIEPAIRSVIQRKSAPSAASISARNAKSPEGDAPVQAAVPPA